MVSRYADVNFSTDGAAQAVPSPWASAKAGARFDTEMAVLLRICLAGAFSGARSWPDLIQALRRKGFYLQRENGRVRLHDAQSGAGICSCRFVGFPAAELERRFGAALPDSVCQAPNRD